MDQDHLIERKVSELIANNSDSQLKCLLVENGLANVPLTAHTKSSLLKQLARKLLNLTSSPEAEAAVTVAEPQTNISLDASSAMTATEQHKNTPPETLDSLTVGAAAVAEQHKQISSEEAKVESNNNTDSIRKTLEEAKESLSFCLNEDNKTHYAVCIPGQDDSITVHTDFREVLKLMKENKAQNPRMLSFRNKAEAEAFAEQHTANEVCEGSTIKSSYPEERAEVEQGEVKLFPSLTTPQLSEFRIQLEKGNVSFCRERILSNPRFLIGNGDMPTILKEGPRYNAMHASVIAGQLESCRLIMEMVSDVEFLKRMYVTQARAEENSQRLTDLYLNTPDKIANKTPLHFASEKGMVDIVAFLVTFQACIRNFNRHMLVSMKKGDKQFESRVCTGKTPEEVSLSLERFSLITKQICCALSYIFISLVCFKHIIYCCIHLLNIHVSHCKHCPLILMGFARNFFQAAFFCLWWVTHTGNFGFQVLISITMSMRLNNLTLIVKIKAFR
uniref:LEM domain-containing protein n=1 Tax=Biomphalaria glabrata TaxID=6526 RepID=A0A2C9LH70_BIOGL